MHDNARSNMSTKRDREALLRQCTELYQQQREREHQKTDQLKARVNNREESI